MQLSEYMAREKISEEQFAASLRDVSASGVRKWMRGERVPRPDQQRRIFDLTAGAVTPNDFVLPAEALRKARRA